MLIVIIQIRQPVKQHVRLAVGNGPSSGSLLKEQVRPFGRVAVKNIVQHGEYRLIQKVAVVIIALSATKPERMKLSN